MFARKHDHGQMHFAAPLPKRRPFGIQSSATRISPGLDCLGMRLFVAIPLSDEVVEKVSAFVSHLRGRNDGLRWTSSESWHVTLQFLGNVAPETLHCLTSALSQIHADPFEIQIDRVGIFDRSGVFFAGLAPNRTLAGLHQQVVAATHPCGFEPDSRSYHPHITLARSKGKDAARTLSSLKTRNAQLPAIPASLSSEFLLYESFLSPSGSRYEVRQRFPLT